MGQCGSVPAGQWGAEGRGSASPVRTGARLTAHGPRQLPLPLPAPRSRLPLLAALLAACSSSGVQSVPLTGGSVSPAALARADGGIPPYTEADVRFMAGMIPHHEQAVLMAGWAPSHGASQSIQTLAARIVVAQRDEIAFLETWLARRGETGPMDHAGHAMMPGMLSDAELARLDAARGRQFDSLFLVYMIQHHEGALTMVDQLFGSSGAAQDDDVFRFAADVSADQSTEIDRMQAMLGGL